MADEYLIGDKAWSAIDPLLPKVYAGARRKDDRRVISGIVHVLRSGCRWQDCPAVYGPSTTVYNRFNRWSRRGLWQGIFDALAETIANDTRSIDSTSIKVQRSAAGGEGGAKKQKIGRSRGGRTTNDAKKLRVELALRGTATVIPTNPTHKHQWYINLTTYKDRNLVERMWCRMKDYRRIATRYDNLARNFASSVALVAVIIWWTD